MRRLHHAGSHGNSAAAVSKSSDNECFAREENAGGAQDAVKGGLAGSVHVVEIPFQTASLTAMTVSRSPAAMARSR